MDAQARRAPWRLLVVPLVAAALLFGWLAYEHEAGGSSAPRPAGAPAARPTLADVMLAAAAAKAGIFLEYDGVTAAPGPDHSVHAQLTSFQWGVGRAISSPVGAGREPSPPSVSEVVVGHRTDKYSAKFLQQTLTGTPKHAEIYFTNLTVKGAPVDYLVMKMENTLLSGFSISSGGDRPSESMSLNFTKFTIQLKLGGVNDVVTFDLTKAGATMRAAAKH